MSQHNLEIGATFISERQRWGDTILGTCTTEKGSPFTVKTQAEPGELVAGLSYSFYGRWRNHPRYGQQFEATSFVPVQPHDEAGTLAYLKRAPGIGPATAKALWNKYQGEAVRRLREDPALVVKELDLPARQFNQERAEKAAAYLNEEKGTEDATIELMSLLAGRGFPRMTLKRALRKWGNRAAQVVKRDPYKLMAFPGSGFLRADSMFLDLGHNAARLRRQTLCMWHATHSDNEGHTWFIPAVLEWELRQKISSSQVRAARAAKLGVRSGILAKYRDAAGNLFLTEMGKSKVEELAAGLAARMLTGPAAWPPLDGLDVSDHQLHELGKALSRRLGIFGGGPGTGKTYTAARLIARIHKANGGGHVAVVAPTGKAAVRISEALAEYGLPIKAKTIHSFLEVVQSEEGGAWSFRHCEEDPVEEKFVIVDESSMIDVSLFSSLLRALPPDAHLLLVGDVQQLPPVGHGAPLRDLLATPGCPRGELREIRRNSGAIVETCALIRDEQPLHLSARLDLEAGKNLAFLETRDGAASCERILSIIRNVRDRGLQDPVWETQVIVAVNEKSPLSRKELNVLLQAELNGVNRSSTRFWVGDKVVCLKNGFWPAVVDALDQFESDEDADQSMFREDDQGRPELRIANGELGRVLEDWPQKLILEFFNPRRIVLVPRAEGGGELPFDLGYAISCHKAQGSEWPLVIVAVDDYGGARLVCDRSWIYTAISRSKKACLLVGQEKTLRGMIARQKIHDRRTLFVERLAAAQQKIMSLDGHHEPPSPQAGVHPIEALSTPTGGETR